MWAVSLSGLLGKMTRTHPRLNLLTNTKNLILKKLEYVMMVGFIKMISSISMCSSLIKEVSHFLQGSSTLTKYCWINNICSWFIVNLNRVIENNNFHFRFSFLQTPDNDTVLAALLEVMVETSMLLFRCCKPWIISVQKEITEEWGSETCFFTLFTLLCATRITFISIKRGEKMNQISWEHFCCWLCMHY